MCWGVGFNLTMFIHLFQFSDFDIEFLRDSYILAILFTGEFLLFLNIDPSITIGFSFFREALLLLVN